MFFYPPRLYRAHVLVLATALLSTIGCNNADRKLAPVRGVIRFPDGTLLREGTVEFEIIGREKPITATGRINADGSFVLGTYELSDGALIGKHRVVVIADQGIGNGHERPGFVSVTRLHPRYRDYRTSKLSVEVKPQSNEVLIDVEFAQSEKDKVKADELPTNSE